MTIIGVAPEGFSGTTLGEVPQIFVPLSMRERLVRRLEGLRRPAQLLGLRLRPAEPGVTMEQAAPPSTCPTTAIINDVEAGCRRA